MNTHVTWDRSGPLCGVKASWPWCAEWKSTSLVLNTKCFLGNMWLPLTKIITLHLSSQCFTNKCWSVLPIIRNIKPQLFPQKNTVTPCHRHTLSWTDYHHLANLILSTFAPTFHHPQPLQPQLDYFMASAGYLTLEWFSKNFFVFCISL